MKKQVGIWIDSSKAIFISFPDGERQILEIASAIENSVYHGGEGDHGAFMGGQHISNERKFEERKRNQEDKFLKQVLEHIKDKNELYILGPAEMKTKLKHKIEEEGLANYIKSVETAEAMTTNQLVAKVKDYFQLE